MKSIVIKNMMVPIEAYATVPQEATLYEAVVALEEAQKTSNPSGHKHLAILVLDEAQNVVGKVTMFDILIALEPKYRNLEVTGALSGAGYSPDFITSMLKDNVLWNKPLDFICSQAVSLNVSDFMEPPAEGMYINENATLNEAIHQLVVQKHQSLLVNRNKKVVGVLKLVDVFTKICDIMKACEI